MFVGVVFGIYFRFVRIVKPGPTFLMSSYAYVPSVILVGSRNDGRESQAEWSRRLGLGLSLRCTRQYFSASIPFFPLVFSPTICPHGTPLSHVSVSILRFFCLFLRAFTFSAVDVFVAFFERKIGS